MNIKAWIKKLVDVPTTPLSEIDVFLREFDVKNPQRSASQLDEIARFHRLAQWRDGPT